MSSQSREGSRQGAPEAQVRSVEHRRSPRSATMGAVAGALVVFGILMNLPSAPPDSSAPVHAHVPLECLNFHIVGGMRFEVLGLMPRGATSGDSEDRSFMNPDETHLYVWTFDTWAGPVGGRCHLLAWDRDRWNGITGNLDSTPRATVESLVRALAVGDVASNDVLDGGGIALAASDAHGTTVLIVKDPDGMMTRSERARIIRSALSDLRDDITVVGRQEAR